VFPSLRIEALPQSPDPRASTKRASPFCGTVQRSKHPPPHPETYPHTGSSPKTRPPATRLPRFHNHNVREASIHHIRPNRRPTHPTRTTRTSPPMPFSPKRLPRRHAQHAHPSHTPHRPGSSPPALRPHPASFPTSRKAQTLALPPPPYRSSLPHLSAYQRPFPVRPPTNRPLSFLASVKPPIPPESTAAATGIPLAW